MKLGEALLLNICSNFDQKDMKDSFVTTPHSIKASFVECYGPEFIYTPLFHERSLQEVSLQVYITLSKVVALTSRFKSLF